ncbi:hypothetical protein J3E64_003076 [Sphingobium sp. OAS761]|uniref:hypothetical protein n=1 Tax=Sphingobium sp. OAS761 TaxID=2817901 RepID=UPI00209C92A6|nr:hypothetical protein [Sphingobium sp. OAS761]MCP1471369.1 hypothetical protein [Sphingobium sp. OAS761]
MSRTGPWGATPPQHSGGKHIRQAGVARDGAFVLPGRIRHPVDDDGIYPNPQADYVRMSRTFGMRIVRCRAARDISGFVTAQEFGGEAHLPEPIASTLSRAFSGSVKHPISLRLNQQAGVLAHGTNPEGRIYQPLSDWSLEIEDRDDDLHVTLSATLHGLHLEEWQTRTTNHWEKQAGARIVIQFVIDAITRVACFGYYAPNLSTEAVAPAPLPPPATLTELDISTAPVGTFNQCGVGPNGLVSFHEAIELGYLSLTRLSHPARTEAGFLPTHMNHVWPRLTLHGVTMASIRFALLNNPAMRLNAEGDCVGNLQYGGPDGWMTNITRWMADIRRDETGLHFDVEAHSSEAPRRLTFRLPWEMLILRYPGFLPHQPD